MMDTREERVPLIPKGYLAGRGFWAYFWFAVLVQVGAGTVVGSSAGALISSFFGRSWENLASSFLGSYVGLAGALVCNGVFYFPKIWMEAHNYSSNDILVSFIGVMAIMSILQIACVSTLFARFCHLNHNGIPKRTSFRFAAVVLGNSVLLWAANFAIAS